MAGAERTDNLERRQLEAVLVFTEVRWLVRGLQG